MYTVKNEMSLCVILCDRPQLPADLLMLKLNDPVIFFQINAVRAIVPNKSNNEIILVLQHFDNCVDKTVQAFMEGNSSSDFCKFVIVQIEIASDFYNIHSATWHFIYDITSPMVT